MEAEFTRVPYKDYLHKHPLPNWTKICHKCGMEKNAEDFYMEEWPSEEIMDVCKECTDRGDVALLVDDKFFNRNAKSIN